MVIRLDPSWDDRQMQIRDNGTWVHVTDYRELQAEADRLRREHSQLQRNYDTLKKSHDSLVYLRAIAEARVAETDRLIEIITRAMSELGVPGPGYPAPVSNAVEILCEAAATKRDTTK